MWQKEMGSAGACNPCGQPASIAPADKNLWTCNEKGDISLNLEGAQPASKCMSWSTEGSCEFRQKDLRALQVTLDSVNCDDLWVAPLWMCPASWENPQHQTGEVDFFERGCATNDGYLLSFGESSPWIINDAWKEKGLNNKNHHSSFTAFLTFDPTADEVCAYQCPTGADPLRDGVTAGGCELTMKYSQYFSDTSKQTKGGTEYMHLVSDVWNKCSSLNCGKALKSSECRFQISGLKLKFSDDATDQETTSPFKQPENPSCSHVWYRSSDPSPSPTPQPIPLPPSYTPSPPGTHAWYDDSKTLFGVTGLVVAFFFVVVLVLRKKKQAE